MSSPEPDLILPPEVELVNPDLYLFTVDDDDAFLEVEMTVESGRGYSQRGTSVVYPLASCLWMLSSAYPARRLRSREYARGPGG